MRSCGLGYSALEKFCGLMNIPPPVTKNNYSTIANKLRDSARTVATDSMSASAEEAKQNEATSDISVSVDGTWQKGTGKRGVFCGWNVAKEGVFCGWNVAKGGFSVDGTWQKRGFSVDGFSSMNGVVVAVSTTNFKVSLC